MRIHLKLVKRFIKDKYASALIEYGVGLAVIGLAIIFGTSSSGQAIKEYMFCVATGGSCNNADDAGGKGNAGGKDKE